MNWENYPNFTIDELKCKHCGECEMQEGFMLTLQSLRKACNFPFIITSGYRCPEHNKNVGSKSPAHPMGKAVDIRISGNRAYALIKLALLHGFTGVGVAQKGNIGDRFIHLDTCSPEEVSSRPCFWSY